jgi:site-specific recombinase XerD
MGKVRKRAKNYFIDFRVGGKRHRKIIGPSKKLAELTLKDLEVRIAKDDLGFVGKDTGINDLFHRFVEFSEANHSPNTFRRYRSILDNFTRYLTRKPHLTKVMQLNAGVVDEYKVFRKNQGAKSNTVNVELKGLKVCFNYGIKWGLIGKSPMSGVEYVRVRDAKPPRFLTEEECSLLLENCGEILYPIFYAFLHTGLRLEELRNLEWSDVDFGNRKLYIRRKIGWAPKGKDRELPMTADLVHILKRLKRYAKSDYVFENTSGGMLKRKLRRDLMSISAKCGFPDVTKVHSLRHTFASHLIMKGVDLPTVQKLLGHSDIQTTMIYSHLAPDHLVDAVNKLGFDKKHKSGQPKKSLRHRTSAQELV